MEGADAHPGLHALHRAGRRLGHADLAAARPGRSRARRRRPRQHARDAPAARPRRHGRAHARDDRVRHGAAAIRRLLLPGRVRLDEDPGHPPADTRLCPDRLTGRPARMDRGEVQGVDGLDEQARGRGEPRPDADQRVAVLADRDRGVERAVLLRVRAPRRAVRPHLGRAMAAGDAGWRGGLPEGRGAADPPVGREDPAHADPVDRIRPGRPLRRHGAAGSSS